MSGTKINESSLAFQRQRKKKQNSALSYDFFIVFLEVETGQLKKLNKGQ